jgi:L-2,4-diaminobutyrate decarboxylase
MMEKDFNYILDAYHPEKFRKEGHALVDLLADYLKKLEERQEDIKVLPHFSTDEAFSHWENELENPGTKSLTDLFSKVLNEGIHLHHPGYMGHQINPPAPSAALGGLLNAFMNNGMAVFEMGVPGTSMERAVINVVARTFGFSDNANGLLCNGGTLANLTALLTARACISAFPVWNAGNKSNMALMVSEEAHYCVERAARIMGWGSEGIIKIPVDDQYKMRTNLLPQYLEEAKSKGIEVIAVVGSACSTATGSFDNLKEIGSFCKANNLWFHVDGAHGAANAFSEDWKFLVEGIETADSVAMDFHKMLLAPSLITALVLNDGRKQFKTFAQHAHYLWENDASFEWHNVAKRSFECTKSMLSLPVYTLLYQYGTSLFSAYINRVNNLCQYIYGQFLTNNSWEVPVPPSCNIICFRFLPTKSTHLMDINHLNKYIREQIILGGKFYIVQTVLSENVFLRLSITNALTTEADLDTLIDAAMGYANNYMSN